MVRSAVTRFNHGSAIDALAQALQAGNFSVAGSAPPPEAEFARMQERRRGVIAELLVSGVHVLPQNAAVILPIAASLGERQEAEMAARRSESRRWRAHEAIVGLAFDQQELRDAERAVEARCARLRELEGQVRQEGGERDNNGDESEDDGSEDVERESEGDCEGGDKESEG
jgi:hypothetical protein